jgi:hypothetical protein
MNLTEINNLLESFGFPHIVFDENRRLLSDQELLAKSQLDEQTLLSVLSEAHHPLCESLCAEREMVDILLNSLIQAEHHVPQHIVQASEFQQIPSRDKKMLKGQTQNGLFYFLQKYPDEIAYPIKPITRRDGSNALLIEDRDLQKHLSVDEFYAEEREYGNYFFHYAHISMLKRDARVRLYFDTNLKLVKTSAFIEVDGLKIDRVNPMDLDLSLDDYQDLLQILTALNTAHRQKIQSLDLAFTPQFMFINHPEKLAQCRKEIAEMNRLKSPLFDCRETWLHRDIAIAVPDDNGLMHETSALAVAALPQPSKNTKISVPKLKKSKAELKNERMRASMREIDSKMQRINELILISQPDNLHINQALEDILNLEFLLIHHLEFIGIHREGYDQKINEMKLACLNHLHDAFIKQQHTYLDKIYEKSQYIIDSMIHKYMNDLVRKLKNLRSNVDSIDKHKLKNCLELMGYFYDKNELYNHFFNNINTALVYSPSTGITSNFIMRVIDLFDVSLFIGFLIDKKYIKPTDCIGIVNNYYMSLQQYILLYCLLSHENYCLLLNKLMPHIHTFFDLSNFEIYKNLIEQVNQRQDMLVARSASNHSITAVQKIKAIDFVPYIKINPNPSPLDNLCRRFFICDPVLAFNYLGLFLGCHHLFNFFVPSAQPNILLVANETEMKVIVEDLAMQGVQKSMTHIFYPAADTLESGKLILEIAREFLNQICVQSYLFEQRQDERVILQFMKELNNCSSIEEKTTIITASQLYILKMSWTTETFKKYCFFALKKLEIMAQHREYSGIIPTISILNSMSKAFNEESLLVTYRQMLQKSIDKIKPYYPIEREMKQLLP